MKDNFERAFSFTVGQEGVYSNDPDDPGGETKYRISKRSFPSLDIKNLTLDEAKSIYYVEYWMEIGGDDLPFPLDAFAFDAAVNLGVGAAKKILERSNSPCQFLIERTAYYVDLAEKSQNARKFFRGWINRVAKQYMDFRE